MQLLITGVLAMLMALAMMGASVMMRTDHEVDADVANATVDQYRTFIYSASMYMQQSGLPSISTATAVPWSTISASPLTPPGAKNVPMPSNWHIVRNTDGTWTACTEMNERAIAAIRQLIPSTSGSTPIYSSGVVSSVVMGTTTVSDAQTFAAQCSI